MRSTTITHRLTLAFAAVMAVILLGGAVGVYFGEQFSLDRNLRRELARQADEIRRLVDRPGPISSSSLRDRRDSYVQVLDRRGREVAATPPLRGNRFLTSDQVAGSRTGVHTFQRGSVGDLGRHSFRIRTEAVRDGGARRIIVVATSRDARDEALRELAGQLAAFSAAAMVLIVLVGYRLTRAALRPVERLRQEADELYRGSAEGTLAIPPTHDEIAALAATFNDLLERIQATVQHERAFSAAASHELRTPLTSLKAELDLALREPRSHEELRAAITEARADTQRLIGLAEDLLLLRTPGVRATGERLDLAEVVRAAAARGDVDVCDVPAGGGLVATGSRQLVDRAIDNLLDNARAYGRVPVSLSLARHGSGARITVADDGEGFSDAFRGQAFDQFARGPHQSSGTGSGLGLAIVRAIAGAHGGTAGISQVSQGAEVWFELPLDG